MKDLTLVAYGRPINTTSPSQLESLRMTDIQKQPVQVS